MLASALDAAQFAFRTLFYAAILYGPVFAVLGGLMWLFG